MAEPTADFIRGVFVQLTGALQQAELGVEERGASGQVNGDGAGC